MLTIAKAFRKSLRKHGVWGTTKLSFQTAAQMWRCLSPTCRSRLRASRDAERSFDLLYNVDTAGIVRLDELHISSANSEFGSRYQAISPGIFSKWMGQAGDIASGRVFIDFGCGKGRALLLASEYGFRRIVGIEFSDELAGTARANIRNYRNPRQICRNIEVVGEDAAQYRFPDEPLVLYFYNPFGIEVKQQVVDNLRGSLERHWRPITVIDNFYSLGLDRPWDDVPLLKRCVSGEGYAIYQCDSPAVP